jgi:hypothetical protein
MNKGEWGPCVNYVTGDTTIRNGKVYQALQQNAGIDPENNPVYWQYVGMSSNVVPPHDGLDGLHGTSETEFFHLNQDQAAAALYADEPSATNPFITQKNLPALGKRINEFENIAMPAGMGIIYGAYFDEPAKRLIVVGDDRMASLDTSTRTWTAHTVPAGPWRAVTKFGNNYIVVGKNAAMAGPLDTMASVPIPAGDWRDLDAGNSRVVAVADGRVGSSPDGTASWSAKDVATGYGDSVAYSVREGKFFAVGLSGCKSIADNAPWGDAWAVENIPAGTWRDVISTGDYMIALSGTAAHKKWDETAWVARQMPSGGWEAAAAGAGFVIGVGNGIAASAKMPAFQYTSLDIPNNVYTCAAYGASTFWVLGSAILSALVVDTGAALDASGGPNADNPYVTHNDLLATSDGINADIATLMNAASWGRIE